MTPAEVRAKVHAYLLNATMQPFPLLDMGGAACVIAADVRVEDVMLVQTALEELIDQGYVHYLGQWLYVYKEPGSALDAIDTHCAGRLEVRSVGPYTSVRSHRRRPTRPPTRSR
jgi:hypothetical protein